MNGLHVVVLGGSGNFGARIVRALQRDAAIRITSASRIAAASPGAAGVALDCGSPNLEADLRALAPDLVIHCVGPFQGQDYRVAQAVLAAGAHYVDLADGRDFVVGFEKALQETAVRHGRVAITGASTLPALSSAVVDALREPLRTLESIDVTVAPGQLAARGAATLTAVTSYLGKPISIWKNGRWQSGRGWMDLRRLDLDIGSRWGALCDVPDLTLFPERYAGVRDVRFQAALEFKLQHASMWLLAAARGAGWALPVERWAALLNRLTPLFDPFAGDWGGMRVSVTGENLMGRRVRRTWQLRAPAADGPEVPCMASVLLARRMARGMPPQPGARVCMGILTLADFAPEFARWKVETLIDERHF